MVSPAGEDIDLLTFPWKKLTLKEALFLDEKPLTHCLYAFHDRVNWLYIGISHRLITRLYQHLGIARGDGERLMDPAEAVQLLTYNYEEEQFDDPIDFLGYLDYWYDPIVQYDIFTAVRIQPLGLFIMNNRPQCLEWGYYYAPIQPLYPNAEGAELDGLLAKEEKRLIIHHKPLFNKQHNKQTRHAERSATEQ